MKKELIQYLDFQKLDIRVGEVISAENLEKSKKLIRLQVNLGEEYGKVQILSGIAEYYKPEDLVGNKYLFIANLEPRAMMGTFSNGMILAADDQEKAILLPLNKDIPNGTIIR